MKKLIFAAAVAASMGAFALESANVVGFQDKEITTGQWNCMTATFLPTGAAGTSMTLGDIKANDTFAFGDDTLQTLNGNGGTLGQYTYCNEAMAEEFGFDVGWYNYEDVSNWDGESALVSCNNVSLPWGTMVIIQSSYEGAGLVYAGEVLAENKELSITTGEWNMLGNATPVDLTLGDIAANDTFAFGDDTLQTLNGNGGTLGQYTYCNEAMAAEFGFDVGWYNYEDVSNWDGESQLANQNSLPIPSGYGFVLQSSYEGAAIILPKAY